MDNQPTPPTPPPFYWCDNCNDWHNINQSCPKLYQFFRRLFWRK